MYRSKQAIIIPCYNEEASIALVIESCKEHLPDSTIYIVNNNSTDKTKEIALAHGAMVIDEKKQGKGHALFTGFKLVDADSYLMLDGDNTCPFPDVKYLLDPIVNNNADMVVGNRLKEYKKTNTRRFHNFGNDLIIFLVTFFFKGQKHDILSGYRAFSKEFIKTVPIISSGFEIETELSLYALYSKSNIVDMPIYYQNRSEENSTSKLRTFRDGFRIIFFIARTLKNYRPLFFFSILSLICFSISLSIFLPILFVFFKTSLVPRFPSLIFSIGLLNISFILLIAGFILDSINHTDKKNTLTFRSIIREINTQSKNKE